MTNFITSFDLYNIRARISVGVIFLAPSILELYMLVPVFNELSATIIFTIIIYALCNLIIIFSRRLGNNAIKKCYENNLLPAQSYLLPSNDTLDDLTKQRYLHFLQNNIEGFQILDSDKEMLPMVNTAINWLKEQTRNKNDFSLIHEENINFGFAYNLYGIKIYGVCITIVLFITNIFLLYLSNTLSLSMINIICSMIIDALFLFIWLGVVNKDIVIFCGHKYAIALLAACDSPLLIKQNK